MHVLLPPEIERERQGLIKTGNAVADSAKMENYGPGRPAIWKRAGPESLPLGDVRSVQ